MSEQGTSGVVPENGYTNIRTKFEKTGRIKGIKQVTKPFWTALSKNQMLYATFDEERVDRAAALYQTFIGENQVMQDNVTNNELLASLALNAAASGELGCWRFVCLPKVGVERDGNTFKSWKIEEPTEASRFNTLTPAQPRDKEIFDKVKELGVDVKLNYVIDDWEATLFRDRPGFLALSAEEQERALAALSSVREFTNDWIKKHTGIEPPVDITYFSSIMDFDVFNSLLDPAVSGIDPNSGIVKSELEFVNKIRKNNTEEEKKAEALMRVAQYAVEGAHLPFADAALYLNAEYPVEQVWKKLTLINNNIPTLFYMNNDAVKNL